MTSTNARGRQPCRTAVSSAGGGYFAVTDLNGVRLYLAPFSADLPRNGGNGTLTANQALNQVGLGAAETLC